MSDDSKVKKVQFCESVRTAGTVRQVIVRHVGVARDDHKEISLNDKKSNRTRYLLKKKYFPKRQQKCEL